MACQSCGQNSGTNGAGDGVDDDPVVARVKGNAITKSDLSTTLTVLILLFAFLSWADR